MHHLTRGHLVLGLSLIFGVSTMAPAQSPDASKGPKFKIDSLTANLGNRWVDQALRHDFQITNTGDAELEISKIVSTNDVTATLNPPGKIAPNGSATLQVTIDGSALRDGAFEKQVSLYTNDRQAPQIQLAVRGNLQHYLDITPQAVGFGKLDGDSFRERRITIRNHTEQPVQITLDQASLDKRFNYELIETLPGRVYELYVDAHPPYQPGTYRGQIKLKTSLSSQPELDIGVFAIIPERVEVLPRVISISKSTPDAADEEPTVHVINIQNNGEKPVKVVGATCDDPKVGVVLKEVFTGRKYRVQVRMPSAYELPPSGANVFLKTDDTEFPVLTVAVGQSAHRTPLRSHQVARNSAKRVTPPRRRPVLDTVGKPAPEYDLKTIEGFPVSNRELVGHPATVLNFFAPNCPHCKRQLPKVEQIRQQFEPMGIRFVNVSERMHKDFTPDEVISVVSNLGANSELAIDSGNVVGRRFKATGYPCLIVVDSRGQVSHVVSGNKKNIVDDVTQALESLLTGDAKKDDKTQAKQGPNNS